MSTGLEYSFVAWLLKYPHPEDYLVMVAVEDKIAIGESRPGKFPTWHFEHHSHDWVVAYVEMLERRHGVEMVLAPREYTAGTEVWRALKLEQTESEALLRLGRHLVEMSQS